MTVRPALQRCLALALLLSLAAGLHGLVVAPLAAAWSNDRAAADMAGMALEKYRRAAAELPALEGQLEEMRRQAGSDRSYLEGEDRTMAAAALQDRLKLLVRRQQGEVRSSQLLTEREAGGDDDPMAARRVGVREEVVLPLAGLQRALYAIESGAPFLSVANLTVRPAANGLVGGRAGEALKVAFDVHGYLGGKAAGGGEPLPSRLPPLDSFAEVLARPLFAPDRRPPAAPSAGPAAGLSLLGIVIAGETRAALVSEGGRPLRAIEGQDLAAGRLERILADRVVLAGSDGSRREIRLFAPPGAAAGTPAVSAQGAAPPRSSRPRPADPGPAASLTRR